MVICPAAHNDGREVELLALDGTIPVAIRGKTENPSLFRPSLLPLVTFSS